MKDQHSELIKVISNNSNRYGDKLIDFMNEYDLTCLKDATAEELREYIEKHNLKK